MNTTKVISVLSSEIEDESIKNELQQIALKAIQGGNKLTTSADEILITHASQFNCPVAKSKLIRQVRGFIPGATTRVVWTANGITKTLDINFPLSPGLMSYEVTLCIRGFAKQLIKK